MKKHWTECLQDGRLLYQWHVYLLDDIRSNIKMTEQQLDNYKRELERAEAETEASVLKLYSPEEIKQAKLKFENKN
jgi:hypothetical protein